MADEDKESKDKKDAASSKAKSSGKSKQDGVDKPDKRKQKAAEIGARAIRIKEVEAQLEPLRLKRKDRTLTEEEQFTYLRLSSEYDQLRGEQKRAKAAREQSRLAGQARAKDAERKARLGELLARENLDTLLSPLELLGLLVEGAERATDAGQRAAWLKRGTKVKEEREAASQPAGEPLFVSFPAEVDLEVKQELRALGLKWNSLWNHYEGLADFEQASSLAKKHGGKANRPRGARSDSVGT